MAAKAPGHLRRQGGGGAASVSLAHSHTLTLAHSHTLTLSHSHTRTLSHSHTLTLAHSHTRTLSLSDTSGHLSHGGVREERVRKLLQLQVRQALSPFPFPPCPPLGREFE